MTPKWPRKYAHSSISSLVQSLLPKDTLLRTYSTNGANFQTAPGSSIQLMNSKTNNGHLI